MSFDSRLKRDLEHPGQEVYHFMAILVSKEVSHNEKGKVLLKPLRPHKNASFWIDLEWTMHRSTNVDAALTN